MGRKKAGGRIAGVPNKKTFELAAIFEALKYDPAHALLTLLPELDASKRADVHLKLMDFIYPRRKAIEHSGLDGTAINVNKGAEQALVQEFKDAFSQYAKEQK